jgi:hypothetical protein
MLVRSARLAVMAFAMLVGGILLDSRADEKKGDRKDSDFKPLFNGKDLTGWKPFLNPKAKDADPKKVWTIEDGYIKCLGQPAGYIITEEEYGDYVLRLKWRWAPKSKGGNSGVLLHVQAPDKIWPKSVEAQLMANNAGDFWLIDAKLTIDKTRQDPKVERHYFRKIKDDVEKPIGEWNQYEITCKGNTIKLVINGKEVNEGTDSELTKGKILLQSEGAEIHFKDIEIKSMK